MAGVISDASPLIVVATSATRSCDCSTARCLCFEPYGSRSTAPHHLPRLFVSVFQTNGIAASVILYPALIDIPFQIKQIWARRIDSRVVI